MQNVLGFGTNDLLEFVLALLLVAAIVARGPLLHFARNLAGRPVACLTFLAAVPILVRLALLPRFPVPAARSADDFSYLLLGDTLAHFRLANPVHSLHRFFEGVFVLQEPSWSSIFPPGQGFVLAFGELIFRLPWAGVVLSIGVLCALCYWMLRGWVEPVWALCGGLLAALEFGPLSSWMNTYWGGAVSGIAGCLVFGALPRLRARGRTRDAVILGVGLGLQLLTRPFEFVLLVAIVLLWFVPRRGLVIAMLVFIPAFGLVLMQNRAVTGHWTTLPYQLSRYQYGVPTTFTFQANPVPHRALTVEQQIDYDAQVAVHNAPLDPAARVRFYRFFFLAPLYLVLPLFLPALREVRFVQATAALGILSLGDAFYPYFYPHYIAAGACLFILVSVKGLERLSQLRVGREAVTLVLVLCLADFIWHTVAARDADPDGHGLIEKRLAQAPGRQLVLVRYWPQHGPQEWIHNAADIDAARVVWAIDSGNEDNAALRRYYPDRHVWLLEPDAHPARLTALTQ
jgi:hypothetical protein